MKTQIKTNRTNKKFKTKVEVTTTYEEIDHTYTMEVQNNGLVWIKANIRGKQETKLIGFLDDIFNKSKTIDTKTQSVSKE